MSVQYYTTCENFRLLDKTNNDCERENYSLWWSEQLTMYGQNISYYVHNYALSGHHAFYGEDPTRTYSAPQTIIGVIELNENSSVLSQFGLMSDDDLTLFIHVTAFNNVFGIGSEPKSGDIIQLTEYGNDRYGGRDGKMFEITSRIDQDASKINSLMGHYIWMLRAKRYDYSFQPGVTAEAVSDQVYEDSFAGRLSGYTNTATTTKTFSGDIDITSDSIFNYDTEGSDFDNVYGQY